MKGDALVKLQIEKALRSNTLLGDSIIAVTVHSGNAYLTGTTDKYPKKELARKIAKEVQGVKTATENLYVLLNDYDKCDDREIESAIAERFIINFGNSHSDITTIVKDGKVWLEGRMKWKYQKELAAECIINLRGIIEIHNHIVIPEKADPSIKEKDVFAAIYGDPSITTEIKIDIIGSRVVIKGKVHNSEQKNLVTRLVRNVTGVREIENFLTIGKI